MKPMHQLKSPLKLTYLRGLLGADAVPAVGEQAPKETIKAATIARVTSKETGKFLGFLVKSNHTSDYYEVACTKIAGECVWSCTCKSGQNGFMNCKPDADGNRHCCHIKACREVCVARNARIQAQKQAAEAEVRAEIAQATIAQAEDILKEERAKERTKRERAPLTSNSGFSFMR